MAKKKEIYFGKGFKRIYFVLAGLWLLLPLTVAYYGNAIGLDMLDFFFMIAAPFVVYFILLFFIKGFKK